MKRRRHRPLVDGWVCPRCGQKGMRHGHGGARACKSRDDSPRCRGLECTCQDGQCYSKSMEGFGWRRSPCPCARCYHCGWQGEVRSRDFERVYGNSRCPSSSTGWHHPVISVVPNQQPSNLVLRLRCPMCGLEAETRLDPIEDMEWMRPLTGW